VVVDKDGGALAPAPASFHLCPGDVVVAVAVALDVVAGRSFAAAVDGVVAVTVVEIFYYFCEMFTVCQRHFFIIFFETFAMLQRLSPR
jgi:hypothetical protein